MLLKKCLLGLVLSLTLSTVTFANTTENSPAEITTTTSSKADTKAVQEIQSLIKKIDFDIAELADQTVKVHFMVNTANEIIVLKTNSKAVDRTIKFELNYKSLKNKDLEANKIYVLPISFKKDGVS